MGAKRLGVWCCCGYLPHGRGGHPLLGIKNRGKKSGIGGKRTEHLSQQRRRDRRGSDGMGELRT